MTEESCGADGGRASARDLLKKVKSTQRRSRARTRESLSLIRHFEAAGERGESAPSVRTLLGAPSSPHGPVPSITKRKTRGVGSWAETTDLEKLIFACRAIESIGRHHAVAFSLNLNPEIERRARSNPDWARRRVVRLVGSTAPLVMAFGAADGRLHVHGAMAATSAEDIERISAALETAGGSWASPRGDAYQLHLQPIHSPDGWAAYLLRNVEEAKRVTAARPLRSMTHAARRAAKALHADVRRIVNAGALPNAQS